MHWNILATVAYLTLVHSSWLPQDHELYGAWDGDRDADWLYGGSGLGGAFGAGDLGASGLGLPGMAAAWDYYGRDPLGGRGIGGEHKDGSTNAGNEDSCKQVMSQGVVLPDLLRQVTTSFDDEKGWPRTSVDLPEKVRQLTDLFIASNRTFWLAHCPQAVVLATMLQGSHPDEDLHSFKQRLIELFATIAESATQRVTPMSGSGVRPTPKWIGEPWEVPLRRAQQQRSLVLFRNGDLQFHVEAVTIGSWNILPNRRCQGRRDLGNLQATPLSTCLQKCLEHPLCLSATFWHLQPGGFGFEQRCFLSSSCSSALVTSDGAEGAVVFEKKGAKSATEKALLQRIIMTPSGTPWAPRCGHHLVSLRGEDGQAHLLLIGGVGVDPFNNNSESISQESKERSSSDPMLSGTGPPAPDPGKSRGTSSMGRMSSHYPSYGHGYPDRRGGWDAKQGSGGGSGWDTQGSSGRGSSSTRSASARAQGQKGRKRRQKRRSKSPGNVTNVIQAYLSRHVELSGELPPLRALPYGRLGDVWSSSDHGATWTLLSAKAPFGRRAFFSVVVLDGGRSLLLMGGVREPPDSRSLHGISTAPVRRYTSDVWLGTRKSAEEVSWKKLHKAPWDARASFQAVLLRRRSSNNSRPALDAEVPRGEGEVVIMGGRLMNGSVANDVWSLHIWPDSASDGWSVGTWEQRAPAAQWTARADFAATVQTDPDGSAASIWIMGGTCPSGKPLADVWWSRDGGSSWHLSSPAAPWGSRLGAVVRSLPVHLQADDERSSAANLKSEVLVLFGGYSYADAGSEPISSKDDAPPVWISADGTHWISFNATKLMWTPTGMHAAATIAPCEPGNHHPQEFCMFLAGGVNREGYYENMVHRLWFSDLALNDLPIANGLQSEQSSVNSTAFIEQCAPERSLLPHSSMLPLTSAACISTLAVASLLLMAGAWMQGNGGRMAKQSNGTSAETSRSTPPCIMLPWWAYSLLAILVVAVGLVSFMAWHAVSEVGRLSRELRSRQHEDASESVCGSTAETPSLLMTKIEEALALQGMEPRMSQIEILLRLASRESQFGFGYGSYASGRSSFDYWGHHGEPGAYDYLGGGLPGTSSASGKSVEDATKSARVAAERAERELALLPTTQMLSCRSPRCDRNATSCQRGAPRSLEAPYGCCSDYMLIMLQDVTKFLEQRNIPYFITYGTLLGALREGDVLPWTQDMDIVVDRSYWVEFHRGLEAMEFFGGRRYFFGVDQWEAKVSRVCADWEGFAPSLLGGSENDRYSRSTEFHLDVYASDWWQITDLHLMDCVEPLGRTTLPIRGQNFSAPARPRACVEKLYGSEWRIPKHALSGVN